PYCPGRPAGAARRAIARCRGSAIRWWARRGCTGCGRYRAWTVPWTASRAAPRRRTAWSRSGRAYVVEADGAQGVELARNGRHVLEQLQRILHGHVEHVGNRVALVQDLQRLAVVA